MMYSIKENDYDHENCTKLYLLHLHIQSRYKHSKYHMYNKRKWSLDMKYYLR